MNSDIENTIDILLSSTKVARIIEENSELRVRSIRKLGEGLEFQSFLVNENWVFRFPKHFSEALDPVAEQAFSENLNLSISIPKIRYIWNQPWGYPETISGYGYLSGLALEHVRAEELDQESLANQLGTILAELHTMKGFGVTSVSDQLATLRSWFEDLDDQLSGIAFYVLSKSDRLTIKSYFDQYEFDLPDSERVLIHGDLGADHILLNDRRQLTGIIDWSNFTKGNRCRDFVGIWRWGGDAFCMRVFSYYPFQPSPAELAFVRVMGLVSCISREILLSEQSNNRVLSRARELLTQRLSDVTNRCPYEPLLD